MPYTTRARRTNIGIQFPGEWLEPASVGKERTTLDAIKMLVGVGFFEPTGLFQQWSPEEQQGFYKKVTTFLPNIVQRLFGAKEEQVLPYPTREAKPSRPGWEQQVDMPTRYVSFKPPPPPPMQLSELPPQEEIDTAVSRIRKDMPELSQQEAKRMVYGQMKLTPPERPEEVAEHKFRGITRLAELRFPGDPNAQQKLIDTALGVIKRGDVSEEEEDAWGILRYTADRHRIDYIEAFKMIPYNDQVHAMSLLNKFSGIEAKGESLKLRKKIVDNKEKRDARLDKMKETIMKEKDENKRIKAIIALYRDMESEWKAEWRAMNSASMKDAGYNMWPTLDYHPDYVDIDTWAHRKYGIPPGTIERYLSGGGGVEGGLPLAPRVSPPRRKELKDTFLTPKPKAEGR